MRYLLCLALLFAATPTHGAETEKQTIDYLKSLSKTKASKVNPKLLKRVTLHLRSKSD
tara:strand:- start:446 stop:619 length:174 start_codon:yes stop_codon:yes gene_type:complete